MIHVGFTGSRFGMLPAQRTKVVSLLSATMEQGEVRLHHGDCIGSDAIAHDIAMELGLYVIGHPPENDKYQAFCPCNETRPPKRYTVRDYELVAESQLLIATPDGPRGVRLSGTWTTIGYGTRKGIPVYIIMPNGFVERRNMRDGT